MLIKWPPPPPPPPPVEIRPLSYGGGVGGRQSIKANACKQEREKDGRRGRERHTLPPPPSLSVLSRLWFEEEEEEEEEKERAERPLQTQGDALRKSRRIRSPGHSTIVFNAYSLVS